MHGTFVPLNILRNNNATDKTLFIIQRLRDEADFASLTYASRSGKTAIALQYKMHSESLLFTKEGDLNDIIGGFDGLLISRISDEKWLETVVDILCL
jgi:hypothetical protein